MGNGMNQTQMFILLFISGCSCFAFCHNKLFAICGSQCLTATFFWKPYRKKSTVIVKPHYNSVQCTFGVLATAGIVPPILTNCFLEYYLTKNIIRGTLP